MSLTAKSVSLAVLVALAAACTPPPPKAYEAAVALPKPPEASAVAHLKPTEACAALAGDPLEGRAMGRGAFLEQIDARAALKACDLAVANGQGTQVDYYNRARAMHAVMLQAPASESARWAEDALTAYEMAAGKGHPYALMLLAELRLSDLPNRPKDAELSAQLRNAAFEKLGNPATWWPETKFYVALIKLRDENFQLLPMSKGSEASSAKSAISNAARGGMIRYIKHEYDMLRCDDFDAPAPGNPRGEVCEMFLTKMAENGMVVPASDLAVRHYNAGVRAAQRHGVRHNDARNGYSNGKYWAEMALKGKIDTDANALRRAREVRDTATRIETQIANQDKAVAAVANFFGKILSGSSGARSSSSGYQMDTSHLTDPRKNGTCLGAGLAGDAMELFASGC